MQFLTPAEVAILRICHTEPTSPRRICDDPRFRDSMPRRKNSYRQAAKTLFRMLESRGLIAMQMNYDHGALDWRTTAAGVAELTQRGIVHANF